VVVKYYETITESMNQHYRSTHTSAWYKVTIKEHGGGEH